MHNVRIILSLFVSAIVFWAVDGLRLSKPLPQRSLCNQRGITQTRLFAKQKASPKSKSRGQGFVQTESKEEIEKQQVTEEEQSLDNYDDSDGPIELVEALKNIAAQNKDNEEDTVELPYGGVLGYKPGKLYEEPVNLRDPILNPIMTSLDSLPGEEGSEGRNQAIQKLIEERMKAVMEMEKAEKFTNLVRPIDPVPSLAEQIFRDFTFQDRNSPPFEELLADSGYNFLLLCFFALFNVAVTAGLQAFLDWWMALDFEIPDWLKPLFT